MTGDEADEVLTMTQRIGPVVLSSAVNPSGTIGTSLRRAVGIMVVDVNMVELPTFVFAFGVCLDLARHGQATLVTMDRVRKAALAESPVSLPAALHRNTMVRMVLATESRIIAYMRFRSREEVDAVSVAMNAAFSATIEIAADDLDTGTYQALISLHGNVIKHLSDRGRLLPRIIAYEYPMVMPALRMAQRVYTDATRYQELIDENHVVHPAFMPREGKLLAV